MLLCLSSVSAEHKVKKDTLKIKFQLYKHLMHPFPTALPPYIHKSIVQSLFKGWTNIWLSLLPIATTD